MKDRQVKVSIFLCLVLRHKADDFGLVADEHGFVPIDDVLRILQDRYQDFNRKELLDLIEQDSKGRYEIVGDKMRARYGHSYVVESVGNPVEPPAILYHGTPWTAMNKILHEGLKPMRRQYVHLSQSPDEARAVGQRHSAKVAILKIHAQKAHFSGIEFFSESNVYLSRFIPPGFIEVTEAGE